VGQQHIDIARDWCVIGEALYAYADGVVKWERETRWATRVGAARVCFKSAAWRNLMNHSGMKAPQIDALARDVALIRYALPLCLHVAIAARDEDALERFVGQVESVLVSSGQKKALLVRSYDVPEADNRLPIWQQPGADILRAPRQVWVDVDCRGYRRAYSIAFPEQDLTGLVLDHVMNRRVARLKGFRYLRIVPISRAANSSSGGLSEKWGAAYHSTPRMVASNKSSGTSIQYADLADIVKMLDIKTGGSLQDAVNEAQALVTPL